MNGGTKEAWRFTGFYGEPDANHREEAWSMLCLLQTKPHLLWCCKGDFNELLHTEEKGGGRLRPNAQMQAFHEALDFCGFLDLSFIGLEFTWHGRRHEHMIWERLERGVANYDWMSKFLVATVRFFTATLLTIDLSTCSLTQIMKLSVGLEKTFPV